MASRRGKTKPASGRAARSGRLSRRFKDEAKALGQRIRAVRDEQELTLEAASERMEMDWSHLAKVEAGAINVTLGTLIRIADGLSVPVGVFFPVGPEWTVKDDKPKKSQDKKVC
jgi:hypothetical protein